VKLEESRVNFRAAVKRSQASSHYLSEYVKQSIAPSLPANRTKRFPDLPLW
jgi:hypothetical protein